MQDREHTDETVPAEVQEIVRDILSAVRAVKLYPSNNPVYSQAVAKSYKNLERFLQGARELRIGVQKAAFIYGHAPLNKDSRLSAATAGDLFSRGIREMAFIRGVAVDELLAFYTIIALPMEECRQRGGVKTLLWDRGASHIVIKEADLEGIHEGTQGYDDKTGGIVRDGERTEYLDRHLKDKEIDIHGKKVMLTDLTRDPASFGNLAAQLACQSGETKEEQEKYLLDVYREVGRQVLQKSYEQRKPLFQALASSIFSIDAGVRDRLISRRLYPELDRQSLRERLSETKDQVPHSLHEITSARFSQSWTVPQVSALLEKVSSAASAAAAGPHTRGKLPDDLPSIARELSEYTPEEMEALKRLSESGQEEEMLTATVATLIQLLPATQHPLSSMSSESALTTFSKIVSLLEDMLFLLLDRNDYRMAATVLLSFRMQVAPEFRQRFTAAIKKAGDKKRIHGLVRALRTIPKDSADYQAIVSYISLLDREATPVLLEMLAEEDDRVVRKLLLQILKDLGKNQIAFMGEHLSDERWYFVRNIVSILGESRKEEAVAYLSTVAGHKNFQIRQEVVRALTMIGGKKAVDLLLRFLKDRDVDIRFMAIRGLCDPASSGAKAEQALMECLKKGSARLRGPELKYEAVETLGKIGSRDVLPFLAKFTRVRWWKARKPQEELRAVAQKAIREIERRHGNAG